MRFAAPEWFLFIAVLIVLAWRFRGLRLARPLRALLALLVVIALAGPELRSLEEGLDLWVLVDRSASARDTLEPRLREWEALLADSKGRRDEIRFIDFSDIAVERGTSDAEVFSGNAQFTRLALAARHALSQMDPSRNGRLLTLTDGYSTEPLDGLAARLQDQQVALDYRLAGDAGGADVRVHRMRMPSRVQVGEPYVLEAEVRGEGDVKVPYTIYRGEVRAMRGAVDLVGGQGTLRLTDRRAMPASVNYRLVLHPADDPHPGNNHGDHWIEVMGGPRILLVSGYDSDPLAGVLRRQGFAVDTVNDPRLLDLGRLGGVKVVILNNLPSYKLPPAFLHAFDFAIRRQGMGLLMAGGKFSFGSGGYFESPIDPLLPVSMELREEHKKLAVAMGIVMDRSGSMGAGVAGGKPGTTKMDLANEGAGRAIELLGNRDAITVFAVDSKAHSIVPLTEVGPRRNELVGTVRRIQSMGGGIFVYNGLEAAWDELKNAAVGQRHIILFSDAADSEQPGGYKTLIAEMVKENTTVSVIGLGTETDTDADFLKDIARRGNGRMFFNSNAGDLPALFAQEAVTVARSAFLEETVGVSDAGGWLSLAAQPMAWLAKVDGYNLSYLRPEATAAALSSDEYRAPLVAMWQRGRGRTAAVSFPLAGEFSGAVRAWAGYGDFIQTLTRWLMGEETPPGVGLRHWLDGTVLRMDLLFDDRWMEKVASAPPEIALEEAGTALIRQPVWEKMAPGHYQASVELSPQSVVRGAVQVGDAVLPMGPVSVGRNAEWDFDRDRVEQLRAVAEASGGGELTEMAAIWDAPRREAFRDARLPLYVVILALLLIEALVSRMGWKLPAFSVNLARQPRRARVSQPERAAEQPEEPTEEPPPVPVAPKSEDAEREERKRRFARAKGK